MLAALLAMGAGATLGAASGFHCIAMCGPLAAATCGKSSKTSLEYLAGRTIGYGVVGAIAGSIGAPIATGATGGVVRVIVAALVALVLVHRGITWVRPSTKLIQLRKKPSTSLLERLLPIIPRRGLGLGLATAIFPCGALLGGVVASAATGSTGLGALSMVAFALASAPLLMVPTLVGRRLPERLRALSSRSWGRKLAGAALIAVGAWIVAVPVIALASAPSKPACCQHHHG